MNDERLRLPETCAIAYKEWAGVCHAIKTGRQAILLRKGGIAEDGGRFRPEHDVFWLFPTYVHEQQQGLKAGVPTLESAESASIVTLSCLVVVTSVRRLDSLEQLAPLEELHVWTRETIEKRFHYREPGLWQLTIEAFRRNPPHAIARRPEYAGCRTWVELGSALAVLSATPVASDPDHGRRIVS